MRVYHIQRAFLRAPSQHVQGFDSAFEFDYMGSAEFEFGALPKSLRRIVANKYAPVATEYRTANDQSLFIVSRKEQVEEVKALLPALIANKHRLKEPTYLDRVFAERQSRSVKNPDLWWDIDNDWFLCLGNKAVALLLAAIKAQAEKWQIKA